MTKATNAPCVRVPAMTLVPPYQTMPADRDAGQHLGDGHRPDAGCRA